MEELNQSFTLLSIQDWIDQYLEKRVYNINNENTVQAKKLDLAKFIGYYLKLFPDGDVRKWNKALTKKFIEHLMNDYELSTVKRVFATLSNFANYLEKQGVFNTDTHPTSELKLFITRPKEPKTLIIKKEQDFFLEGKEVVEKIIECIQQERQRYYKAKPKKKFFPYRDLAMVHLLYHTGIRVSELCSLTLAQVEFYPTTNGIVLRNVKCKGNKFRDIYINSTTTTLLLNYIEKERGNHPGFLFFNWRGKKLTRVGVWGIIKAWANKTKLQQDIPSDAKVEVSPHRFRHERAFQLLRAGFSESEVAEELGHSSTQYVGLYVRRSERSRFEKLEKVK